MIFCLSFPKGICVYAGTQVGQLHRLTRGYSLPLSNPQLAIDIMQLSQMVPL